MTFDEQGKRTQKIDFGRNMPASTRAGSMKYFDTETDSVMTENELPKRRDRKAPVKKSL